MTDSNPCSNRLSRPLTAWPSPYDDDDGDWIEESMVPEPRQPSPRLSSESTSSDYIPVYLDFRRLDEASIHRRPATAGTGARPWAPPLVRGRDPPFPPPIGREYPIMPLSPRLARPSVADQAPILALHLERMPQVPAKGSTRGRGLAVRPNTAAPGDRHRMYFDLLLQEWRPIPNIVEEKPGRAMKARARDNTGTLKKLGKGIVRVVKDLGDLNGKKASGDLQRRTNLQASVSFPRGNSQLRR